MAGVKISALPPGGEIQNNDLLPVARGVATFSVRGDVIFPITEPRLGDNSVSNRTLSANVISLDKIRTIPGNRVLGNSSSSQGNVAAVQVVEGMIANDAVTSEKIKEGEVKNVNILNNTVNLEKLQQISANRVLGATVAGNVIETQIVENMIATDAVTSLKIKAGEVKRGNIENSAINRDKIAANEVMFGNIQQIGGATNSVLGYTSANTNVQALKIVNDMIASSTITSDKLAFAQVAPIPTGGIIMWSGSIANIPNGWALCNGSNGTPDLRDRFVVGAGTSYAVGATGGVNSVTLDTTQIPAHNHSINDPGHWHAVVGYAGVQKPNLNRNRIDSSVICCGVSEQTGNSTTGITINNAGEGQAHENRPPYYALAFIMKL